MPGELQFDSASHIYKVDGIILPSVTQVLQDVGIIDYSMMSPADRERYLQRGKDIHAATHYDDDGDLDEASFDPELLGYLEAWRKFRADTGFLPDMIEHRDYHRIYGYAGTLDRSGACNRRWGTGRLLLDLKTGELSWWVSLQLAAYAGFFDAPAAHRRIGVEAHADGTYRVQEFACKDFAVDFQTFLCALTIYREKRRHH